MKRSTKNSLFLMVLFIFAFGIEMDAQYKKHKKVEAAKIAFITKELDLTPAESETFWPIYNAYHKERDAGYKAYKDRRENTADLSDSESDLMIDQYLTYQKSSYENTVAYINDLKKVLPSNKIIKLQVADRNFRKELLKKARGKRKGK